MKNFKKTLKKLFDKYQKQDYLKCHRKDFRKKMNRKADKIYMMQGWWRRGSQFAAIGSF